MDRPERVVRKLVGAHGRTYAEDAGIGLKDTPQPLYRLLVLSHLLSARIRGSIALATARALHDAGLRDPRRTAQSSWQERVDAPGRGGYRRYDERTATLPQALRAGGTPIRSGSAPLGDAAELLTERWGGDLRRLRREADAKALQGAERLNLPADPERLTELAGDTDPAVLAAALVRAAMDKEVARDALRRAG
ncbi:endonuclease [Streptomyces sp. NPDC002130]|uniref:endonuclease n=1 Tax=Streptomyces sp. NPDC002130 TaxID=3155568 RepID=UPI003318D31F